LDQRIAPDKLTAAGTRIDLCVSKQVSGSAALLRALEIENMLLRQQVSDLICETLALRERLAG
jgi:hypothetical protein